MTKKFQALIKTSTQKQINITNPLVKMYTDPVFQDGLEFCREVIVKGSVDENVFSKQLLSVISKHIDIISILKIEFLSEVSDKEYQQAS